VVEAPYSLCPQHQASKSPEGLGMVGWLSRPILWTLQSFTLPRDEILVPLTAGLAWSLLQDTHQSFCFTKPMSVCFLQDQFFFYRSRSPRFLFWVFPPRNFLPCTESCCTAPRYPPSAPPLQSPPLPGLTNSSGSSCLSLLPPENLPPLPRKVHLNFRLSLGFFVVPSTFPSLPFTKLLERSGPSPSLHPPLSPRDVNLF